MSVRVNLLPWRSERRAAQRRHLGILAGMVAGLAAAVVLLGHFVMDGFVRAQESRNAYVKKQNEDLDKEIKLIDALQKEISDAKARRDLIERLQADRSQAVVLLDQMVRLTPDGVYLKTLKQNGAKVAITGYATSNAQVSNLMRNVAGSTVLQNPELIEIKAATVNNRRLSEFAMNLSMKQKVEEPDKAGAKGAKAGAAKK